MHMPTWLVSLKNGLPKSVTGYLDKRHWVFYIVQVAAVVWAYHWWPTERLPYPGYAIGVLAVAAAVMTFHGDMKAGHKAAWILIIAVFLVIEFKAIDKDRAEFAKQEEYRRKEESKNFGEIVNGLKAAIDQSGIQFSETMAGFRKSIDVVTGGKTFCFVRATPIGTKFLLDITTKGDSPLHDVSVEFTDNDSRQTLTYGPFLFLASSSGWHLNDIQTGDNDKRSFTLRFFSPNGVWYENLKLKLVNGRWEQAIKVYTVAPKKNPGISPNFTWVSKNFPRKDGKVLWDN